MDPARDPKTFTDRLEVDYYERPGALRRGKWFWSVVALVVSTVLAGALIAMPRWHSTFQAGPVSSAHAVFGADCSQCHDNHYATAARLIPGITSSSVSDAKCLACHPAGRHDPHQTNNTSMSGHFAAKCVSCHMEHRGPHLARLSDQTCVRCHADIKTDDGKTRYASQIQHFAQGHPEFGSWRGKPVADPAGGKFFFNHERHLNLANDLKDLPADRRPTLAAEFARMRDLDCIYCHTTDADGKRMQPIRYDAHCAACHPLTVAPQPAGIWPDDVAAKFLAEPLKHPGPGQTRDLIRSQLLARYLSVADKAKSTADRITVQPNVLQHADEAVAADRERLALDRTRLTEGQLFGRKGVGCNLCHAETGTPTDGLPTLAWPYQQRGRWRDEIASWPDPERFRSPAYADAANRWFPLATFDHRAHRTYQCTDCHAARTSSKTEDVLLPNHAKCAECHNGGSQSARSDCLTCHTYHDRSQEHATPKTLTRPAEPARGGP